MPQKEMGDDELVELVKEGDTDALDVLLHRYTSYARAKAKTYFLIGADREDIVQEGMIGLFKAIRDYDATKTVSFRSFAELCITRQIITAIKGATRQKHQPLNSYVSLHRPLGGDDEDGGRELVDFLASARIVDPVEQVVAEDEVAQIREFLTEILSDLEVNVLNQYLEGRSYQEIASSLRRQAKSIDNALQRIKRKLETFLDQREQEAQVVEARGEIRLAPYPGGSGASSEASEERPQPRNPDLKVVPSNGHGRSQENAHSNGNGAERASARNGDLRASLKMAAAVAARGRSKSARSGRGRPRS